jgi:hypothetical protein
VVEERERRAYGLSEDRRAGRIGGLEDWRSEHTIMAGTKKRKNKNPLKAVYLAFPSGNCFSAARRI